MKKWLKLNYEGNKNQKLVSSSLEQYILVWKDALDTLLV